MSGAVKTNKTEATMSHVDSTGGHGGSVMLMDYLILGSQPPDQASDGGKQASARVRFNFHQKSPSGGGNFPSWIKHIQQIAASLRKHGGPKQTQPVSTNVGNNGGSGDGGGGNGGGNGGSVSHAGILGCLDDPSKAAHPPRLLGDLLQVGSFGCHDGALQVCLITVVQTAMSSLQTIPRLENRLSLCGEARGAAGCGPPLNFAVLTSMAEPVVGL